MNFTEGTTSASTVVYTYSFDGREWWEGSNGIVRRHDGRIVHCEIVGELDEMGGFADFLAFCSDGELIIVSGRAMKAGMLADMTPYWKHAK